MAFKKKTKNVETITAKLHDTVAELQSHAEDQLHRAAIQREVATAAEAAHLAHVSEHDRARIVASNISSLLGIGT